MDRALNKEELRIFKKNKQDFLKLERNPIFIILDNLKSSHNIGNIFRLSDSMLVKKIYLCGSTFTPPSQRIRKGSRGADKWVPWEYKEKSEDLIINMKNEGIFTVAAEISRESIQYDKIQYRLPICIIVGNEDNGLSSDILNIVDQTVHLPIFGMTNSLNVSSVVAVILYHIFK